MTVSTLSSRFVLATLLAATVAGSGCSLFRRGADVYAGDAQSRPLEVPPDLDAATVASATNTGPVTASGAQQAAAQARAASGGFTVTGERDAVFARVGEVLATVPGLVVNSRAQLLGAFDVTLDGSNFLVRVAPGANGLTVSATDPRGVPAAGDAPRRVLDTLKAALAP